MFNPEQLKRIALAKRKELALEAQEKKLSQIVTVDEDKIVQLIKDVEALIVEFAENGELQVDYTMKDHDNNMILELANQLKMKHPLLMIISSLGEKKLTITWDGMNYV